MYKTLAVLLLCASWSWAVVCPEGWGPTPEGVCQEGVVHPSSETPPKGKMPSYQREGVHVVDVPAMTTVDDEIATAKKHEAMDKALKQAAAVPESSDTGKAAELSK